MLPQKSSSLEMSDALQALQSFPAEWEQLKALITSLPPSQRATCPACAATTVQVTNVQKQDLGAALLAEWAFESTAAGVTAGSNLVLTNVCVACGCQWVPASPQEALARLFGGQLGDEQRVKTVAHLQLRLETKRKQDRQLMIRVLWLLLGGVALVLYALSTQ
jgi:hypothetical protein